MGDKITFSDLAKNRGSGQAVPTAGGSESIGQGPRFFMNKIVEILKTPAIQQLIKEKTTGGQAQQVQTKAPNQSNKPAPAPQDIGKNPEEVNSQNSSENNSEGFNKEMVVRMLNSPEGRKQFKKGIDQLQSKVGDIKLSRLKELIDNPEEAMEEMGKNAT